jgi:luciferase family oxidoreductase group 1
LLFEHGGFPDNHPFRNVRPMPADVPLPPIFLLGSSDYSAQLAAHVGAGFSFAHHFSDFDPVMPMTMYRKNFRPSPARATPYAILGCHVVCADTDEEAERLATTVDLNFARRRQGHYLPLPSPEEAAAHVYSPTDRALIAQNRARLVVGSVDKVMAHLEPLIRNTQADELMITTMIYDHEARKHSYELLAKAFGLSPS